MKRRFRTFVSIFIGVVAGTLVPVLLLTPLGNLVAPLGYLVAHKFYFYISVPIFLGFIISYFRRSILEYFYGLAIAGLLVAGYIFIPQIKFPFPKCELNEDVKQTISIISKKFDEMDPKKYAFNFEDLMCLLEREKIPLPTDVLPSSESCTEIYFSDYGTDEYPKGMWKVFWIRQNHPIVVLEVKGESGKFSRSQWKPGEIKCLPNYLKNLLDF